MELREYQLVKSSQAVQVLKDLKLVVLQMECRTGKTYTALHTANNYGAKNVLFITKLKAMESVKSDFINSASSFDCTFINIESLKKVKGNFDLVIFDEYHNQAFVGKPLLKNKSFARFENLPMIGLTGTLFPEGYNRAYSLFKREFKEHKNFYEWFRTFGTLKHKYIGGRAINDYSEVNRDKVFARIGKYIVSITQEEAGFESVVEDVQHKVYCPVVEHVSKSLRTQKVITLPSGDEYIADSVSQEFSAICQIAGGTLKTGPKQFEVISFAKLGYIRSNLLKPKMAIYYKFKAELAILTTVMQSEGYKVFEDAKEFQDHKGKALFLAQFRSGREGVKLDFIDDIIFYSMPYSNLDYMQSRERILSRDKQEPCRCHVLLTGIEKRIYDTVKNTKGKFNTESYKRFKNE